MDSENKYGSDGVPFTGKVVETKPLEQPLQQIQDALDTAIQAFTDALDTAIQAFTDAFVPCFEFAWDSIVQTFESVMKLHPNKRIVWLAFHHKKAKVRNKNRKRILKDLAKAVKRDG